MKNCIAFILVAMLIVGTVLATVKIDQSGSTHAIRITRGEKVVFEFKFETSQHIYACEESPSGYYLLVWHMEKTPRRLKVFRLTDGAMVADFVPGYGGNIQWTYGDKILHAWGCGTNCQNICVYDITGATLYSENVTGHYLTDRGYYLVFPTISVAARKEVYKYDVNTGKKTVLVKSLQSIPAELHLEDNTLIIEFIDHETIRVVID